MDIAYLAGVIDGEGCIQIKRNNFINSIYHGYSLTIAVKMCCEEIVNSIQENFGGGIGGPYRYTNRRTQYSWQCHGVDAGEILKLVLPHLIEKREQAKLGIEYIETIGKNSTSAGRSDIDRQLQELYYLKMRMFKKEY